MGLMMGGAAAEAALSVVVLFPDHSEESGAQSAENAMTRVFRERGYKVVDRGSLEQILRRDTALLGLYEIETAKQLGSRLQADIVVKATSRVTTREKTYSSLGGKKVLLSQADVSAKLMTQFAENLGTMLESDPDPGGALPETGGDPAEMGSEDGDTAVSADAVDLLDLAGGSVLKRLLPALIVVAAIVVILILVL